MHWHMILTERCNLKCEYCYGKSMIEENDLNERFTYDYNAPCESKVDIEKLKGFLLRDTEPVLIFYGGEPLLQLKRMKKIIDGLKDVKGIRFMMQTNGRLLDLIDREYLIKIDKMLVSLDGNAERTDSQRGLGGYEIITENLKKVREEGYTGEIVGRMTISYPDIYEQVMHLVGLIKEGLLDSIHWQIDAGFYTHDFDDTRFRKFVKEYNKGVSKLVDWWVSEIRTGKVWKLYPLLGIFENLYHGEKTKLMCGAGYANYTITTDGKLAACPIMNGMKDFYAGDLDSKPKELKEFSITGRCEKCSYLGECGGRCLYQNVTRLWPLVGEELICDTIKHLIDSLRGKMGEVRGLIENGAVNEKDFEYEKYFGPEIIP